MTLAEWQALAPASPKEIARRQAAVDQILAHRAELASVDVAELIRQVREERAERYRSWLTSSS